MNYKGVIMRKSFVFYCKKNNSNLLNEWDYSKNKISPEDINWSSKEEVWWICPLGHSFKSKVISRTNGKSGCPYCSHFKVLKGVTDLKTVNAELAKEWNYKKNGDLKPEDIFPNHHNKVWRICPKGHEFEATPLHRNSGTGCPICSSERQTSFPEQMIYYYMSKFFKEVENRKKINNYEFDIYIGELNIAIEYDGSYYHKDSKIEKDNNKNLFAKQNNINLIRIIENKKEQNLIKFINENNIYCLEPNKNYSKLKKRIENFILKYKHKEVILNISEDYKIILNNTVMIDKNKSLGFLYPDIAKEWNYEKNKNLKPNMFMPSSNFKVWWICSKGHEYEARINNRIRGNSCPYCCGKKVLKGFNSLGDIYPISLLEWDYKKNTKSPYDYTFSSSKIIYIKCSKCGYEFKKSVNNLSKSFKKNYNGCPICAKKRIIEGINDFGTKHPEFLKEWDYDNNKISPNKIASSNTEYFYRKCSKCGNVWKDSVSHRINRNSKCPYCSSIKIKIKKGLNDLTTTNEKELMNWDYTLNKIKPEEVTNKSHEKVYWKCPKGHSYLQQINTHLKGIGCPYCSNHKVLTGFNDLKTTNPEIMKIWDNEENNKNNIYADKITKGSKIKVNLICSKCGFKWKKWCYNIKNCICPNCKK